MEREEEKEKVASEGGSRSIGSPSTSSAGATSDVEPDELEGFDDYTIASSWERFTANVESICREWQAAGPRGLMEKGALPVDGSKDLYRVHQEVSFGKKLYVIVLFFHGNSHDLSRDEWPAGLHHLQLWFGVTDFLVAAPVTLSGVILDAPEATTLLSTVAVALSSCGSYWPAFVPVHDRTRKSYKGIQGTSSSYSITYEAERIDNWVPVRLMHLAGLYELFVSKVAFTAPNTAAVPALRVEFTMRLTYQAPMIGYEFRSEEGSSSVAEAKPEYDGESPDEPLWDEDLPWAEWHNVDDPVKGFELVAIWTRRFLNDAEEMSEYENTSTFQADQWFLIPTFPAEKEADQPEEGFAWRLQGLAKAFSIAGNAEFLEDFANVVKPEMDILLEAFTVPPPSVLERVLKDLFYEAISTFGEGFSYKPRGHSVKGSPRDSLFGRFSMHSLFYGTCNIRAISELWIEFVREIRFCWDECQPLPRVSPEEPPDLRTCLLCQKLQMLAVCIKLKTEEKAKRSPLESGTDEKLSATDTGIHGDEKSREDSKSQNHDNSSVPNRESERIPVEETKLQTEVADTSDALSYNQQSVEEEMESLFNPRSGDTEHVVSNQGSTKESSNLPVEEERRSSSERSFHSSEEDENWQSWDSADDDEAEAKDDREGSAGPLEGMMLLHLHEPLHAPITQRLPVMTEDMLREREQAIAALSRSHSEKQARLRLQTDILTSDMAAFKAANPRAVFEDFIRWHSPRDWINNDEEHEDGEISGVRNSIGTNDVWPPKGRLSQRMSEAGNMWAQLWDQTSPQPAREQKLLFDYQREGEKVIHYLDTVRPQELLAQMLCTVFMNCMDVLKSTQFGSLSRLQSQLSQLQASADMVLEPITTLTKADLPSKEDLELWSESLQQLCNFFRDVESNVFIAASLFQKLKLAPRILVGLYDSIVENGKSLAGVPVGNQDSSNREREEIGELFPPF